MIYIIDANNLAGQFGLLGDDSFQTKLVFLVKSFFINKKAIVFLVFDGQDFWGDVSCDGNLIIVNAPRDPQCQSADDKILEIISRLIKNKNKKDLLLITNDIELRQEADRLAQSEKFCLLKFKKASSLAQDILEKISQDDFFQDERELSNSDIEKINRELLDIWK